METATSGAKMKMLIRAVGLVAVVALCQSLVLARVQPRVFYDGKGRVRARPLPMPDEFKNPWTEELEDAFWGRANYAIKRNADQSYGNQFFENEKRSYPRAMMDFLAGNRRKALEFLQRPDSQAKHTYGVDLYPCFTLKGQVRKIFFFGQYLTPGYKSVFYKAAKLWTRTDPATRPHPVYGRGRGGSGWGPDVKGYCVDRRDTDNLRAMREVSAYLLAEVTGNRKVRDIYKQKIERYVGSLYNIGMGEWDSENYHGHTMTAYVNLYDFAKDPAMRLLGKAAMDWLCAAGAVKYYRGGFGGPAKRDYNKPVVFMGSAADHLHLYFGDHPHPRWTLHDDWDRNWDHQRVASHDQVYFITSAYRPPMAVVALARKQFKRPCELLISHPTFENWRQDKDKSHKPEFFETQYFGHTYQIGTLARGSGHFDVNGFKLMAYNTERGVDYFVAANTATPRMICAPQDTTGSSGVAHYRNLVIWVNTQGDSPFLFLLPKTAEIETEKGVLFLKFEKTWLALHPISLNSRGVDADLTEQINFQHDEDGETRKDRRTGEPVPLWPHEQIIGTKGAGGPRSIHTDPASTRVDALRHKLCGFALEIGEEQTHGDYAVFKTGVLESSRLNLSQIDRGRVLFTGSKGERVAIEHTGGMPTVWRGGAKHDWKKHWNLYQPVDGGKAPIWLGWKKGKLHVEAGGYVFDGILGKDAAYTFTNAKTSEGDPPAAR